ncbi:lectin C-type domain protein [Oesophagostomum dentatum]|uniref:Lectin C-type domain protein n=1 Tax=Oesophagostomum dentatum TaxID=61180 RepID=A0A0B1T3R3_OESDE|nr:lectin C-type domain protein [Oesophagostomum dentatum]
MWYLRALLLFSLLVHSHCQQCSEWTNGPRGTYAVFCERRNSPGAQAACEEHGANLASIHSVEEAHFIFELVRYYAVDLDEYESEFAIVGLRRDLHNRNHFYWTDGSPYDLQWPDLERKSAHDNRECTFMEIPSLHEPPPYNPYHHNGLVAKHCRDTTNIFVCKRE